MSPEYAKDVMILSLKPILISIGLWLVVILVVLIGIRMVQIITLPQKDAVMIEYQKCMDAQFFTRNECVILISDGKF